MAPQFADAAEGAGGGPPPGAPEPTEAGGRRTRSVSRSELAANRPLWLVVGAIYALLGLAAIGLQVGEEPSLRAEILIGLLAAASVAHLFTRPPAIGTVRNHITVATSYLVAGWAMFAIQPGGSLAIGGAMFLAPFIAIRLVSARALIGHLVAVNLVFGAIAASGAAFGLVDPSTVVASLLVAAGTSVQCFSCTAALSAAEQQGAELEFLIRSDVLTGIGNRRLLVERLAERIEAYEASPSPFAVAIVDVNDFKSVNDGAGHLAGDEVLQIVAARLRSAIREGETLVRLGGDEFCLILDEEPGAEAGVSAERVRAALVSITYNEYLITAGVGAASWPRDAADPEQLQLLADARLREDKHREGTATSPAPTDETPTPHDSDPTGPPDRRG
ncbi:MAG: GGDEF domain-containing protein [Solirubrobacteraceae bacterium]|nr:GGDEF domain-containing protein [Solirubrobacteraceae bacterium]